MKESSTQTNSDRLDKGVEVIFNRDLEILEENIVEFDPDWNLYEKIINDNLGSQIKVVLGDIFSHNISKIIGEGIDKEGSL